MDGLVLTLFQITTNIKMYHWKTKKYSEHIACDELYNKLVGTMDKLAEVYLGKVDRRFKFAKTIDIINLHNSEDVKQYIHEFITYFNNVPLTPELVNIRDESVADCNRFIYLLTLL